MTIFVAIILIGSFFSLTAAVMAFLITLNEYQKHYIDKVKPRLMALETAAVFFGLFMVISVVTAWYFAGKIGS